MKSFDRFLLYPCLALAAFPALRQKKRPTPSSEEATFRYLRIVDEKGRMRIVLGIGEDGGAYVATYGEEGKERVLLSSTAAQDVGMVRTFGPDGKERARIGNTANGTGSLEFFATDDKARLRFADSPEGAALTLFCPEEKRGVVLSADAKGGAAWTQSADGGVMWRSPKP
jgi:hypothetical protein